MVDFDKHKGLAIEFCKNKFKNYNYLEEDIQQQAYLGLWKACQSFDETKGFEFSTYAYKCMLTEVLLFLNKEKKYYSVATNYKVYGQDGCVDLIDIQQAEPDVDNCDLFLMQSKLTEKTKPKIIETANLYAKGFSRREISKIQNITEATVDSRMRKCAEILKNFYPKNKSI